MFFLDVEEKQRLNRSLLLLNSYLPVRSSSHFALSGLACTLGLALNFAPDTYFDLVQWNLFSGGPQCILCRLHQAEATGNFHEGQGDALDGIRSEDFRQFVPVVFNVVQFGAADDHRFPPEKILVQVRVGERNAIGHDEEIRILKIGGVDRDEIELDRPMGER